MSSKSEVKDLKFLALAASTEFWNKVCLTRLNKARKKMYNRKVSIFAIVLALLVISCDKKEEDKTEPKPVTVKESTIKQSFDLAYSTQARDKEAIKQYIVGHPDDRAGALYSLAFLGDTSDMYWVAGYLEDKDTETRAAAAFVLGILQNPNTESFLIKQYFNDSSVTVRKNIIEALGRCGTYRSLHFVSSLALSLDKSNPEILLAQAHALNDYARRGKFSKEARARAELMLFSPNTTIEVKRLISEYFIWYKGDNPEFAINLRNLYLSNPDQELRVNLLKSLKNYPSDKNLDFLAKQMDTTGRWEIKIAAAQAMTVYPYGKVKDHFIKLLEDENPNVSLYAANYFLKHGKSEDWETYYKLVRKTKDWAARSIMLRAALKYSPDKQVIGNSIISGYKASTNPYEKASLLAALGENPEMYEFIKDETFFNDNKIISTTGIATLVRMRFSPGFKTYAQKVKKEQNVDLVKEYKLLFKEAMKRGDNAMIYYAATALNSIMKNSFDSYENLSYINNAKGKLILPKDIKAYKAVCTLSEKYLGTSCIPQDSIKLTPPDLQTYSGAYKYDKVIVKTTKGNFIIKLNDDTPIAKSFFIRLVKQNYFAGTHVYKILPGKTVMFSSRRGDNWPDVNIAYAVEPRSGHINKGDVCISPIAKGVNSTAWFVCTSSMHELEGHVTKLGHIIKGYNVVEKLNISDKILSIEIYK